MRRVCRLCHLFGIIRRERTNLNIAETRNRIVRESVNFYGECEPSIFRIAFPEYATLLQLHPMKRRSHLRLPGRLLLQFIESQTFPLNENSLFQYLITLFAVGIISFSQSRFISGFSAFSQTLFTDRSVISRRSRMFGGGRHLEFYSRSDIGS